MSFILKKIQSAPAIYVNPRKIMKHFLIGSPMCAPSSDKTAFYGRFGVKSLKRTKDGADDFQGEYSLGC
jgi:hypothetical protein